ncbi:serine hydrolase [Mobilicoccus caccae]|uniref:Beta-lactamase class A catalytic domain-containing protein n=1 Tax=Mobilicoccus caccae TaxID=1859295 RepID=A0ABQ6IT99_9MICO|nr:serine hydrolase [Mobilicoccus caccae]GMA40528.1 hypothetical protein GCM10025883_25730 [Mobilicoccus caccae]
MSGRFGRRAATIIGVATCATLALAPTAHGVPTGGAGQRSSAFDTVAGQDAAPFSDAEVRRVLGKARDDVSFSVRDRRTGQVYTYNSGMRNSTGSIVKVLVLATIVRERRESGRSLSSGQKKLADRMIRYSDNDATNSLLRQAGGRWAVQRMAKDLGMSRTTLQGAWGRTSTSAADQRLLMDKLVGGTPHLSKADRRYILGLMGRVVPEQRWGVGKVPAGQSVAVKNGWVPLSPRGWRVNSIGSVKGSGRDYTLAILSYDNSSMGVGVERTRKISELVWKKLAPADAMAGATAPTASGTTAAPTLYWIRAGAAVPPHPLR